jgi:hypothetical protein
VVSKSRSIPATCHLNRANCLDFNSVEAKPIEFLLSHPNRNLVDVLPIDNCVLIANTFVAYLVKLFPGVVPLDICPFRDT